jgi:CyaY protein
MNESEFNRLVDDTLLAVEEAIDATGADADFENAGGVLTLTCSGRVPLILSRQVPVRQLWLAEPGGGHHFDYDADSGHWVRVGDRIPLLDLLSDLLSRHCGQPVRLA